MENNSRKDLVTKYFRDTPRKPDLGVNQILIALGILLAIVGALGEESVRTVLIIAAVCLIGYQLSIIHQKSKEYNEAFANAEPKATDTQMDEWLKDDKEMVLAQAYARLDMDPEDTSTNPLIMDGPAAGTNFKIGEDKMLRFNMHDIMLFFLTKHNVAVFKCTLDLAYGSILSESTKEFPYKDITNLETGTVNEYIKSINGKKINVQGTQEFSLYTSGTNSISMNYWFNKSVNDHVEYILPPSDAENTIKAIRKRLKEYKDKFSTSPV